MRHRRHVSFCGMEEKEVAMAEHLDGRQPTPLLGFALLMGVMISSGFRTMALSSLAPLSSDGFGCTFLPCPRLREGSTKGTALRPRQRISTTLGGKKGLVAQGKDTIPPRLEDAQHRD